MSIKTETTLEHAKYFKLYHYAKGITLLEVDMTTDTARKPETVDSGKENAKQKLLIPRNLQVQKSSTWAML